MRVRHEAPLRLENGSSTVYWCNILTRDFFMYSEQKYYIIYYNISGDEYIFQYFSTCTVTRVMSARVWNPLKKSPAQGFSAPMMFIFINDYPNYDQCHLAFLTEADCHLAFMLFQLCRTVLILSKTTLH